MGDGSHDPTLADTTDPVPRTSDVTIDTRYDLGSILGRGGMGEVRTAKDTRIHRDVAVKLLRTAKGDKDTIARFLREAQVQGALEHPAVPPVHDLGVDGDGQPYFVMKKLAGTTLFEVLEARSSSELVKAKWTRRTLLTRLVDVCLAVEFAHTKGIVHRDLKPANIMLGDFGETYVLDWGLARITNNELAVASPSAELVPGHTVAGALLGTPGYMAPEQARGEDVDARADVYALGCILFEILTGVQALPRGLPAIEATLAAAEHRPRKRVDCPPELDELCARATAQERAKRPTARQLADGIQAYLDGDRDHEARRTLANEHVATARRWLEQTDNDARAEAMRAASSALVLDPTNEEAQKIVASLLLEPPKITPPEAVAAADHERGKSRQYMLRVATLTYLGIVPVLAALFVFPVHHAWPIVACMVCLVAMSGCFYMLSRRVMPMRSPWFLTIVVANTLLLITGSFIFGPLLIIPIFIIGSLAGFIIAPNGYTAALIVGSHLAAFLVPLILELVGITPPTFAAEHGVLMFRPWAVELTPTGATVIMVVSIVAQIAFTTTIGLSERRAQDATLDQVHVQQWHLNQLVRNATASGARALPAASDPKPSPPSAGGSAV